MNVMGIDPGLSLTGWGVLKVLSRDSISLISYGCIKTKAHVELKDRLKEIYQSLRAIIAEHKPDVIAIEELFFSKEARTVAAVSQARGAILVTLALENIPVFEYNPRGVKIALTGYGSADKNQIQQMVKTFLRLSEIPKPDDAADALAIAICHSHTSLNRLNPNFALGSRNSSNDAGLFFPKKGSAVVNATPSLFSSKKPRPRSPRFSRPNAKVGLNV